jgi:hypothetical protein
MTLFKFRFAAGTLVARLAEIVISALVIFSLCGIGAEVVLVYAQSSRDQDVARLQAWKEEHSRADLVQDVAIRSLNDMVVAQALATVQRLTALEAEVKSLGGEVTGLSKLIWYLISGMIALLLKMLYDLLKRQSWRPRMEGDDGGKRR